MADDTLEEQIERFTAEAFNLKLEIMRAQRVIEQQKNWIAELKSELKFAESNLRGCMVTILNREEEE